MAVSQTGKALTSEQHRIVSMDLTKPDDVLVVTAFAGTGKTTTLRSYCEARPSRKFLYVVYNKSVRDQAQATFPKVSDLRTILRWIVMVRSSSKVKRRT